MRKLAERCWQSARLAQKLTHGVWRVHAFAVLAMLDLIPRGSRRRLAWIRISLPSGRRRPFWLEDFTQAKALAEVLANGDYDVPIEGEVRTVVDLGANAGQASVYLRDRFPSATILAVEADPDTARLAARNAGADPNTVVVSAAMCDHDGTVTLTRLPGHSWGSNLFSSWSSPHSPRIEVDGLTLGTLLHRHGIDQVDLLKIDIEGAEIMTLTSDRALERVRFVLGELHPSILKMDTSEALGILQRHGGFPRGWMHSEFVFALARG